MIVRNVARGRSFTKLAAYLTSPKDGQHRALWSSIENVGATTPKTAAKIMAAVDLHADELKAAAGVKAGGRKAKDGPVFHLVMSWAEGEKPEQAHQLEAARDMLRSIGLDKAQALIVAHDDNGKNHLHLMVNLVDPETGKRFSLSNDRHKMQEWALNYERANGGVILERREKNAEKWAKGEPQEKADRIPRAAMDGAARAQRRAWAEVKAERDALFERQRLERGDMRTVHGDQWRDAKAEAAAHKAAYKAAFRAAYGREKAAAKAAHKPTWKAVFQRQKVERDHAARHVDAMRQEAQQAHRRADKATRDMMTARRRSAGLIGRLAQRLGLAHGPDAAEARQRQAAEAMQAAALKLAQAEITKAQLGAKQEAERRAIGKRISEETFAKAQLAVDAMPRADFAAMIRAQEMQRAAMIARHNAERAEHGLKPYQPRAKGDAPMSPLEQMKRKEAQTKDAFTAAAPPRDRRQQQAERPHVQSATFAPRPQGQSYGSTAGAPDTVARERAEQAREQARKAEAERTSFKPQEVAGRRANDDARTFQKAEPEAGKSPLDKARERNNTPEAKAARLAAREAFNRSRERDDFER